MTRSIRIFILWTAAMVTSVLAAPALGQHWDMTRTDIYYNDGNVGVGTSSPNALLQVDGKVNMGSGNVPS